MEEKSLEWWYIHRHDELVRKEIECYSCGWVGECEVYRNGHPPKCAWLCDVCANTYGGNVYWYPIQYDSTLYKHMVLCTHVILDAIKSREAL